MERFIQWRQETHHDQDGVITGADRQQEWMLPWWWDCYRKYNMLPVAFADFGMTEQACAWCRERGEVFRVEFPEECYVPKSAIPPERIAIWESIYRPERLWISRKAWFMKPIAMLMSPFSRSVWIDLDCEVRGPLKDIFQQCECESGISEALEPEQSMEKQVRFGLLKPGQKLYNSGVVVYKKGALPIQEWARWGRSKKTGSIRKSNSIFRSFAARKLEGERFRPSIQLENAAWA